MSNFVLNFEITGPQGQTPIVLVPPGTLRGWTVWKPHAEVLSKEHMVIRVQLLNVFMLKTNSYHQKNTRCDGKVKR